MGVGDVAEEIGRRAHPAAQIVADPGGAVEGPGRGGERDAGLARHRVERHMGGGRPSSRIGVDRCFPFTQLDPQGCGGGRAPKLRDDLLTMRGSSH